LDGKLPSRAKTITTNIDVGILAQLCNLIGISTPANKDNARDFAVTVRAQFHKRITEINAAASKAFMIYESRCAKDGIRTDKTLFWFLDNELGKARIPTENRARTGLQKQIALAIHRDKQHAKEMEAQQTIHKEILIIMNAQGDIDHHECARRF
jgi:hypothetical protein